LHKARKLPAALASFAESDQRAPTNILQNRWYALWKVRANTIASYTFWYGRSLNSTLQHSALATGDDRRSTGAIPQAHAV